MLKPDFWSTCQPACKTDHAHLQDWRLNNLVLLATFANPPVACAFWSSNKCLLSAPFLSFYYQPCLSSSSRKPHQGINFTFVIYCSVDQTGQTPLCFASFHGHEAIVEFLFQSGAAIDGKFPDPVDKKPNEFDWKVC